jgi:hypothetical protein
MFSKGTNRFHKKSAHPAVMLKVEAHVMTLGKTQLLGFLLLFLLK